MPRIIKPPIPISWREAGMKRLKGGVPGTTNWMRRWRKAGEEGTQEELANYAQAVHRHVVALSEKEVGELMKMYLAGSWEPVEETRIAAAIRRMPRWLAHYQDMEEHFMKTKRDKETKKSRTKASEVSLSARVSTLEDEVEELKNSIGKLLTLLEKKDVAIVKEKKRHRKASKEERDHKPAKSPQGENADEVRKLLADLTKAKGAGDKKAAFKLRKKLRKAGYSLQSNGGK